MVKNIYYSPDIDRSDHTDQRTYWHDASGTYDLMHLGAYWGPGMEFGNWFDRLDQHCAQHNQAEFDAPFSGMGIRIIKSHVFAYHIDYIKRTWPDCAVVLVNRSDDACLGWWVKCGEFAITYPSYANYYRDLRQMARFIKSENQAIRTASLEYPATKVQTNRQLARVLGIQVPAQQWHQMYADCDISVCVI